MAAVLCLVHSLPAQRLSTWCVALQQRKAGQRWVVCGDGVDLGGWDLTKGIKLIVGVSWNRAHRVHAASCPCSAGRRHMLPCICLPSLFVGCPCARAGCWRAAEGRQALVGVNRPVPEQAS
jgi:hypothetical protein